MIDFFDNVQNHKVKYKKNNQTWSKNTHPTHTHTQLPVVVNLRVYFKLPSMELGLRSTFD